MCHWLMLFKVLSVSVVVLADDVSDESEESCGPKCIGIEYECIHGACYCSDGYYLNYFQGACVRCPGEGEKCFDNCCSKTLQCWHGKCQPCYDSSGKWTCRDPVDQILLVSTSQVVMGTALILGIVATLVLLFKLCATTNLRPLGSGSHFDGRLSIGSLQMYIEERLRDAPPRYSRTAPAGTVSQNAMAFHNECFVHDSSIPPPPYSEIKHETNQNATWHI
ncbi:uncharacterized protein LOC135073838 [Ostrinia nubilalis]|uniref:uncharacterized protein LOC135073838 n=1 Tax=Ostrinia nubilalis TaxID=29057 RepID=UPI003082484F